MTDKRVLDVGCNAGKVTIEIGGSSHYLHARAADAHYECPKNHLGLTPPAQTFGPYRVTGVDIDADLIRKASSQGMSRLQVSFVMTLTVC